MLLVPPGQDQEGRGGLGESGLPSVTATQALALTELSHITKAHAAQGAHTRYEVMCSAFGQALLLKCMCLKLACTYVARE